ncbi:hypothetical protein INS49_003148 [Diaporthe citri]|uniref:uncharacterized protein n=1 Tax=Diaporthe citri TaxID=83186 RepID=UPI001C7E1DEE|nr:uncharacterized protein INS49_003148 [Diaporthe citri]KAG6368930.1 hypothetical protein INS49_003148 [Diaporthe citri]
MASNSSPAASISIPADAVWKRPPPYSPCIHAANNLDPIALLEMEPEKHHRGMRTAVRVRDPPTWIGLEALMTAVEDEEGTLSFLQLFHQPRAKLVPREQTLRPGGCYLIKEPFLTFSIDGAYYSLRVDHPSDILWLRHGHELLPAKWRNDNAVVGTSRDARMNGNIAVGEKRWAAAETRYTTAARTAETAEELHLAYLNRSLANLRLGRPATALADAIKSYGEDSSARTERGLLREASALYELAKYGQCLDTLQTLITSHSERASAMPMIERARARLQERQSGQYDFRRMYEEAQKTPPLIECATYIGAVEIRDSPGKGRGVFTTRKVLAGELLICEKAFGYACCNEDFPVDEDMTELESSKKYLRTQIVQKLLHNIEDARSFVDLYHGDYDAVSVYGVDGRAVVDSFLVRKVIDLAGSGAPRTSLSSKRDLSSKNWDWQYNSAGVCWDFTCDCALCLDRKVTSKDVLMRRRSLQESLTRFMESQSWEMNIPNAKTMLEGLEQSYSTTAKIPGAVRPELWVHYFTLGMRLLRIKRPSEAIEVTVKGLEALGFVISASPPRERPESSEPELLIKQWGMAVPYSADAFIILKRAYKRIAPQLSVAARMYAAIAYTMVMGEKETIVDSFPDMA